MELPDVTSTNRLSSVANEDLFGGYCFNRSGRHSLGYWVHAGGHKLFSGWRCIGCGFAYVYWPGQLLDSRTRSDSDGGSPCWNRLPLYNPDHKDRKSVV